MRRAICVVDGCGIFVIGDVVVSDEGRGKEKEGDSSTARIGEERGE